MARELADKSWQRAGSVPGPALANFVAMERRNRPGSSSDSCRETGRASAQSRPTLTESLPPIQARVAARLAAAPGGTPSLDGSRAARGSSTGVGKASGQRDGVGHQDEDPDEEGGEDVGEGQDVGEGEDVGEGDDRD